MWTYFPQILRKVVVENQQELSDLQDQHRVFFQKARKIG